MPRSKTYPLYITSDHLVFRNPLDLISPAWHDDSKWSSWFKHFRDLSHPAARLGMVRLGLERIRWQDQAEAFTWYLMLANGHGDVEFTSASLHLKEMREAAFDAICQYVFAFAPNASRPFHHVRIHYIDSQDAIATVMWFIQHDACREFNVQSLRGVHKEAFDGFIKGFARLHWSEIRSPVESGHPKDKKAFESWLVANRPCLLRYLYRHKMLELVRLPDDQLTPDDVAVLRTCVFEDPFNAPPGKIRAKTMQEVRENGDCNAWKAVRLITRAEVRHRAAERSSRPSRRRNHRLR